MWLTSPIPRHRLGPTGAKASRWRRRALPEFALGAPSSTEVVIGSTGPLHQSEPKDDGQFASYVTNLRLHCCGFAGGAAVIPLDLVAVSDRILT
jgi:hypothetical protein